MKNTQDRIEWRASLRTEAVSMVANFYPEEMATQAMEKLLHELLVHKVELELQVEELRIAHTSMEEMRDRYLDLYEFAPVGYITISHEGLISDINLTGTALLGIERSQLIKRHFSTFIAPQDSDRWYLLFHKMMESSIEDKIDINLAMIGKERVTFSAHLVCQCMKPIATAPMFRIAFSDISAPG